MAEPATLRGPVLIVGAGLLGTSIGLALSRRGVPVWLRDVSPRTSAPPWAWVPASSPRTSRRRRSWSWSPSRPT